MSAVASEREVRLQVVGDPKRTAVSVVHAELRSWILSGRIAPGSWLRQEELAQALSVSRMPVREALTLLGEEGLVEVLPHRGARVPELSMDELEEIYAARIGLEGLAASRAAERIDADALERLRLALPRLSALCTGGDVQAYLREDRAFMLSVFAASGRPRLVRQIASLRERAERYLRLVFVGADHITWLDHSYQLFQACAAHDRHEAERVVVDAMRWTLSQARSMLGESLSAAK
ncbi:MAG: GntR family transcriptional regulator [Chloroflexi bacterium]|nr:GntR family transcriptional regulator [Chloroflexota bacterium]